jgi:gamma-glutamyl hydrolase
VKRFWSLLATATDTQDLVEGSLMEAREFPFYASQFHPEKNIFEWSTSDFPHSLNAILVSTYFAEFFVNEARQNNATFASDEVLKPYLIYNHYPIFKDDYFEEIYIFVPLDTMEETQVNQ